MIGYIARGSTVNMLNFPKIVGFPGSTPKDIMVEVSVIIQSKVNRSKISDNSSLLLREIGAILLFRGSSQGWRYY